MRVLVKNGVIVSGEGEKRGDVLIEDGKISGTGLGFDEQDTQIIDASGCYVFPGFIDAHTHLDLECAAGFTADDFGTGTRAALAGGTTTILDFATQDKGQTLEQGLNAWYKKAEGKLRATMVSTWLSPIGRMIYRNRWRICAAKG